MAMTTCWECRKAVASDAATCPHCGARDPGAGHEERDAAALKAAEQGRKATRIGCGGFMALILLIAVIGSFSSSDDESTDEGPPTDPLDQ